MNQQTKHKQRATVGVLLAAVGFVTAHLGTAGGRGTLPLLAALGVFVVGLILIETALFRAIDEAFMDDSLEHGPSWTRTMAAE